MPVRRHTIPGIITAVILAAIGLALAAGGTQLIALGGSWYYAVAGIGFVLIAILCFIGHAAARPAYALLLSGTLAWALWEVGLDWWPLGTRGGLVVLIGLWMLTPWAINPRNIGLEAGKRHRFGRVVLSLAVVATLIVAGLSMAHDAHQKVGAIPETATPADSATVADSDWPHYGGTLHGQRYAPLTQINTDNVKNLELAWHYRTGDTKRPSDVTETTYQATPLKVGDKLFLCTPHQIAIALNPETGKEIWRFDPNEPEEPNRQHQTCRGVSYFAQARATGQCSQRIFLPTADARLIALDAETGKACPGFGRDGVVDLWANMPNSQLKGFYYSTSPPVVASGLVIVGGTVNDNYAIKSPSGVIRAYDAVSGRLVWNWDSGNPDRTTPLGPNETYTENSPNSWSVSSADEALGMIYVPLGNRTPDQLGMGRSAAVEKFSSSITALDLKTGKVRWVRQTVHHDLWDMDVPAQPVLVDLDTDKGRVPALVGPTKQGDIYVLDRRTGEPVFPVHEVAAPTGTIPEDFSAPTQPVSALSFTPQPLKESDMWGVSLFDQLACRIKFRSLRYAGRYTPPSLQGSIIYPGNFGVFNWGSVAVDPVRQVMFNMPTYLAFTSTLIPADKVKSANTNKGEAGVNMNVGGPYAVEMKPFQSVLGLPCQAPPWGYVAGTDLKTGKIAWMHKNGTIRDVAPLPVPLRLGVPGIGGPIITAGGVAFLSAAIDDYIRAYDVTTGRQLWQARLPAGGQATPMTYNYQGRQYVVQVAGGHGSLGTTPGDDVMAYALPVR